MGIELHGCIIVADGVDLFKIPLNFACVIPQTEFLGPEKMMNKRILKLCDNLKNWCVSFSPSLSLLFGPSIILSSILLLFSLGSRPWRNDHL